jgi:hypothetical protein
MFDDIDDVVLATEVEFLMVVDKAVGGWWEVTKGKDESVIFE